jgi:hypothetical protein
VAAEGVGRAAQAVVAADQHQRAAMAALQDVLGGGDALVLRRQREAGVPGRRRVLGAVERQHRHRQRTAAEHRCDVLAVERADHEIGALGDRALVGGDRPGRGGVVEADLRTASGLAVVAGEEAVAHRRGGARGLAAERQQQRHALRRPVAVGLGRGARIQRPDRAGVERTRQRQSAAAQGAAGEGVERVAGRQRGGLAGEGGVVQRGQQLVDATRVVDPRLSRQARMAGGQVGGRAPLLRLRRLARRRRRLADPHGAGAAGGQEGQRRGEQQRPQQQVAGAALRAGPGGPRGPGETIGHRRLRRARRPVGEGVGF